MRALMSRHGFTTFRELHAWSVSSPEDFWREAWSDLGILGEPGSLTRSGDTFTDTTWFPEARLNVVDTLLAGSENDEVLVAYREDAPRRSLTRGELRAQVAACASALRASGVKRGDRVAAWTSNVPETVVFALGALAIGAVVSTASSDFGPAALIDRFEQIEPQVLLATSRAQYAGKNVDLSDSLDTIRRALPSVRTTVVLGDTCRGAIDWDSWLAPFLGSPLQTESLPFDHPGFILFSSGTTGRPKCIVHAAAGVMVKVLSEQGYHLDIRRGDRVAYATTCGWMMWNWLLIGLGRGATIVLIDGSPAHPDHARLWQLADDERLTFLGVSAALIEHWRQRDLHPAAAFPLQALRTVASTGSPLAAGGFDWVWERVGSHLVVASISGGTDLCGCLVLAVPTEAVQRGEIQGPALGLDVTVKRPDGTDADIGELGELVCQTVFPSVPLGFWGDIDGTRMRDAYFARFPGVWAHGDFARRTQSGGFEILGRLDATLNAKGVRIGTAEIYRVVHGIAGVVAAIAASQPHGSDTRIVLFVVLDEHTVLDEAMEQRIRQELRQQASPRHVPAVLVQAPDLPRTRSGKLAELAVADVLAGRPVRDTSALANPDALAWIADWAAVTPT